jgi:C1A family cysteine protease
MAVNRILNCIPSRDVENDWRMENALEADLVAEIAIPLQKDLRESWWEVGDQGATGSCVGWATADSVLRWHFVKANHLPQDAHVSVRFIWMSSKETDIFTSYPSTFIERDGTSLKAALDVARKFGAVKESVLPFASKELYMGSPKTFYALASRLKITSYFNLGRNLTEWRKWLATDGPILTRLDVDRTWDDITSNGNLDVYQPDTKRGGHAVALVGYTEDRFIVRNSWGEDWGDKGFAYASNQYAEQAFTEAYGIIV